ncbi:MAG: hypothetical protein FJ267_08635, partial [Planctomycetes bacterium]|nr:hypothetical protein [Planctomycetota bacterium]
MVRRSSAFIMMCSLSVVGLIFSITHNPQVSAASKKGAAKKPIKNPKFDPSGEEVAIFDAIEAGQVE